MKFPKRSEQARLFIEASDSLEGRFRTNWTKAVAEWGDAPVTKKAMRDFGGGTIDTSEFIERVSRTLETIPDSLKSGVRVVQTRGYNITADMMGMDKIKNAAEWGDSFAAQRVTNITNVTREAIRTFVNGSVRDGVPVSTLAKEIRGVLALDNRFAQAAVNYRNGMKALEKKPGVADAQTAKYIARAAKVRATTIARTEVMTALANGQMTSLMEARRAGLLADDVKMVWIAAPGCCARCTVLDGTTAEVSAAWVVVGEFAQTPPLHPNCRCVIGVK